MYTVYATIKFKNKVFHLIYDIREITLKCKAKNGTAIMPKITHKFSLYVG